MQIYVYLCRCDGVREQVKYVTKTDIFVLLQMRTGVVSFCGIVDRMWISRCVFITLLYKLWTSDGQNGKIRGWEDGVQMLQTWMFLVGN